MAIVPDKQDNRHFSGRHKRSPRHRCAGIIRSTAALAGFKEVKKESHSVVSDSLRPHGLYSPSNSPGQNTGVGSLSLLQVSSQPRSPALQVDSLPSAEPQRKPKNTGVGSLSLFQQIFLTQELNQGLLPCRWILYQLIYQGSPIRTSPT